jgi:ABC-2 type transport system ATP-binding protein
MINVHELTKRYGAKTVVENLSFQAPAGAVTGFLGPNGAGKSTTMRMIVGLDAPTGGSALVNGKLYRDHKSPLDEIGVLLDAKAVHPGRSARNHLLALAYTHGIPHSRVDEVIDIAGLHKVADKRVGAFSLGMGQRLGIAAALLGDPETLMLDEPVNGLDPEGVLWIRNLLSGLADEGRTVLLSSHLMSETALVADRLVVIGQGKLLADTTIASLIQDAGFNAISVLTPEPGPLAERLARPGVEVTRDADSDYLSVVGLTAQEIGDIAFDNGVRIHELTPQAASLEEAFMKLTHEHVEYQAVTHTEDQDSNDLAGRTS